MGIYVNPDNWNFQEDVNSEIYVDKTMIIAELNKLINTKWKKVCMSRPRRFGKSYVGHLICAYYSKGCDSRSLLQSLKIGNADTFETYLNRLNVISIDVGGFVALANGNYDAIVPTITRAVVAELADEFASVPIAPDMSLAEAIMKINISTQEQFVIFIDEYDTMIRERLPQNVVESYIDFLRSLFKNTAMNRALALAYVTGLLPIVRDKVGSKMNEFIEYTMLHPEQFAEYMGFTEQETQMLCRQYGKDFDECCRWYDGYILDGTAGRCSVLAPNSVCRAMVSTSFTSYWSQTGAFQVINDLFDLPDISIRDKVLRLVQGERVPVSVGTYMNTLTDFHTPDDVLTYITYIGYLAYDMHSQTCYIPNLEIREQWEFVLRSMDDTRALGNLLRDSRQLLADTINGNASAVASALDASHMAVTSNLSFNNEQSFQSAIIYAYYYAQNDYTIFKELPTGKGYADVVFLPKKNTARWPVLVVELKVDKSAASALAQIVNNRYGIDLSAYAGGVLSVGINYDRETKSHTCHICRN